MKKSLKCVLSVILTAAMLLTVMVPAFAAVGDKAAGSKKSTLHLNFEKVENGPDALHAGKPVKSGMTQAQPVGNVRVSIVLNGKSTLEKGFSAKEVASNTQAKSYRSQLLAQQNALADKISKDVLAGKKLDVKWNLTLAANIISAVVPSVAIEKIAALDGVAKVVIERQYEPAVASVNEAADPNMATATQMTGAAQSWANGYTGAGSKVAIIDTGIDTDHQSFDADAFDYAIEQTGKDVDLLTQDEVADLYDYLNISAYVPAYASAYESSKIPFAVNYIDGDLDITHDNDSQGEHGSHVAGIAAANRFIPTDDGFESALLMDTVLTQGNAPDAQILVMKVFGKAGGAYDSDYFAAIEDAVILGADAVNLSLGSPNPGFATDDTYQELLDNFQNYGAVVSISAGNAGMWADSSTYGVLWSEDKSLDTVGSPGSFANALTVASVDNRGRTDNYFVAHGFMDYPMFYNESTDSSSNEPFTTLAGDREFIYINTPGYAEDFEAIADVLEGKIAICNRGDITFIEKCTNAVDNGAIGVIIANNQSGSIYMALDDYPYTEPAISISQEDGYYLRSYFSDAVTDDDGNVLYYTGTITVSETVGVMDDDPDYYTMSSFSSFGVPGDLSLKPEITAPGGNIYSVNGLTPGGQAYENMSGTSMAAPQVTGLTALLAEYIRENGLEEKTGLTVRQLAQSLLMSTAEPLYDYMGYYYPVIQQGAGLANADSAMNARSYVMMDDGWDYAADGKVKAELGDDPERTGEYEVAFSLNNISDEDVEYELYADFFTQYLHPYYYLYFNDGSTDYIGADVEWTVNGQPLNTSAALIYDFNDDGVAGVSDVRFLLDFIAGNEPAILANEAYADFDEDGDVDTFDAYKILSELNKATVNTPAGGKVDIVARITLDPDDIGYYDDNGNYVEGYIYASEVSTADGAYGVTHSIPVLGFYGNWTESSMTDIGSVLEYDFDLVDRYPYVMEDENNPSVQGFLVKYASENSAYYLSGNPALYDEYYLEERNSFNTADTLDSVMTTLIRNAAASRFFVTDADGEVVYEQIGGPVESAFYYVNRGAWYYTSNSIKTNYTPEGFREGDELTFNLTYAPEYYVNEDGSVDWDALGDGATMSYTAVVDNTAPKLTDVTINGYDPETGAWDELTLTAQDNRYIAAVAVFNDWGELLDVIPADLDADEGAPMQLSFDYDYLYDNSWFGTDRLLIQVYDYACNITNYKINFDIDDLTSDIEIYLPDTASVIMNSTLQLEAEVYPWGVDESVIWSSSDESIATVDQTGLVTGVAEGSCVISATSAVSPFAKADCLVTVTRIEKTLNGVVWDEEGRQWFSEIDVAALPEYVKLTEESIGATITSVSYGPEGYLFASDTEGELYIVDEETLELTDIGNIGIELSDIAASASVGDGVLMAAYGSYILMIDLYTGDIMAFDYSDILGGASIVGIAAFESTLNTYYNTGIDVYFFLDSDGYLYEDAYIVIENDPDLPDGTYRFGADIVSVFGYTTDSDVYNSLYFDGQSIYWARFNDNTADIVCEYDIFDLDLIANLGAFAEDVWPAAALFEIGVNPIEFDFEAETENAKAVSFAQAAVKDAAVSMDASAITMPVSGSLNVALPLDGGEGSGAGLGADGFTQTVELTVDKEATNGLITVKYDASKLAFVNVKSSAYISTCKDDADNGIVTFAYVTSEDAPFAAGDTVAILTFVTDGTDDGEYTVTTVEINDEHPTDASGDITVTNEHSYGDPVWTWNDRADPVTAEVTLTCQAHTDCDEHTVTLEADVEKTAESAQSCTTEESVTYTATVEYMGVTYTDSITNVGEGPTGHNMTAVTAVCDYYADTDYYYCDRCGKYFTDENGENEVDAAIVTEHELEFVEENIPCVADGNIAYYECVNCGKYFAEETAETELTADDIFVAGNGHDFDEGVIYREPTCTSGGIRIHTCRNNPAHKYTEYLSANGHKTTYNEAVEATCTEDGTLAYYECSVCGGQFADEIGAVPMEDITDPATGHAMTKTEAVEATCTEDGNVEYYTCANCGGIFADENGEEALEDVVVPATGHTLVKTEAVAPTCEEDGNVEYYTCSVCGDVFADAEGKTALEEVVDPAIGHAWDEGTEILPATCTGKGLIMYVCANDDTHINYVALTAAGHKMTKVDAAAPSCEKDGNVEYYACSDCGKFFADAEGKTALETTVAPATGHTLVKTEAVAATCTEDGNVEYYTCSVCGKIFADAEGKTALETTVAPATGHTLVKTEAVAATCTEDGNVEYYTCSVCGKIFADAEGKTALETTVAPAKGHTLEKVDAKPVTCTEEGNPEYYVCTVCGAKFEDAEGKTPLENDCISPTGHTLEKVEAKEATYTEEGNIAYYKCSVCGKYYADENGAEELKPEDVVIAKLPYMLGDMTLNGEIASDDARLALRQAVGLESFAPDSAQFLAGDINFDGEINSADARSILRASVDLEDPATWVKAEAPVAQ